MQFELSYDSRDSIRDAGEFNAAVQDIHGSHESMVFCDMLRYWEHIPEHWLDMGIRPEIVVIGIWVLVAVMAVVLRWAVTQ